MVLKYFLLLMDEKACSDTPVGSCGSATLALPASVESSWVEQSRYLWKVRYEARYLGRLYQWHALDRVIPHDYRNSKHDYAAPAIRLGSVRA